MELLFLDTETTGTEEKDRLIQVAYAKEFDAEVTCELFKPEVPIAIMAQATSHITPRMVENKEAFKTSETAMKLQELLKTHALVAHNAKFDIKMLQKEGIEVPNFICTLKIARYLDKNAVIESYGLQYLRYLLDLDVTATAHDAKGDVIVLMALFKRLVKKVSEITDNGEDTEGGLYAEMVRISKQPIEFVKFNFGKHKGKTVAEVANDPYDRSYLNWLLKEKLANEPDDEDWIFTLKKHLNV